MTAIYLIEKPSQPVVSLADMKAHLRVDHDDENDLIEAMTEAATQHIDGWDGKLGRALMAQTWELRLDEFPCGYAGSGFWRNFRGVYGIELPLTPLLDVESVKHYDDDNVLQTIATSVYETIGAGGSKPGFVALKSNQSWPTVYDRPESVLIRFRAGYVDTADSPVSGEVPAPIIAAIKLMVGTLYENRETVIIGQTAIVLPWAAEALLAPFRVYSH